MSWWVGAYVEAGMGVGSGSGTPYLPFAFEAATKAEAEKNAGAKLLAGPFATQAVADAWVTAYERSPNTLHAGNDLSPNPSQSVVKGDNPPNPVGAAYHLTFGNTSGLLWRAIKIGVGLALIVAGLQRMSEGGLGRAAGKIPTAFFDL